MTGPLLVESVGFHLDRGTEDSLPGVGRDPGFLPQILKEPLSPLLAAGVASPCVTEPSLSPDWGLSGLAGIVVDLDPDPAWQDPGTGAWGPGKGMGSSFGARLGRVFGPRFRQILAHLVHLPLILSQVVRCLCLRGEKGDGPVHPCVCVDLPLVVPGLAGACPQEVDCWAQGPGNRTLMSGSSLGAWRDPRPYAPRGWWFWGPGFSHIAVTSQGVCGGRTPRDSCFWGDALPPALPGLILYLIN